MRPIDADEYTKQVYNLIDAYRDCQALSSVEVSKRIEPLADALYKLKRMPTINPYEWISVDDRLPKDFETVLARCKDGGMFVGRHTSWDRWEIWTAMKSTRIVSRTVTHWMPLPSPPTEKEN